MEDSYAARPCALAGWGVCPGALLLLHRWTAALPQLLSILACAAGSATTGGAQWQCPHIASRCATPQVQLCSFGAGLCPAKAPDWFKGWCIGYCGTCPVHALVWIQRHTTWGCHMVPTEGWSHCLGQGGDLVLLWAVHKPRSWSRNRGPGRDHTGVARPAASAKTAIDDAVHGVLCTCACARVPVSCLIDLCQPTGQPLLYLVPLLCCQPLLPLAWPPGLHCTGFTLGVARILFTCGMCTAGSRPLVGAPAASSVVVPAVHATQ